MEVSLCDDVLDEVEGEGEDHCGVLFCADAVQGLGEVDGQDYDDGSVPSNDGNGYDDNDTRMRAPGGIAIAKPSCFETSPENSFQGPEQKHMTIIMQTKVVMAIFKQSKI